MTKKWKRKQRTKIKQGKNRNICFFWLSIIQIFFVFVHLSLFIRKSKAKFGSKFPCVVSYPYKFTWRGSKYTEKICDFNFQLWFWLSHFTYQWRLRLLVLLFFPFNSSLRFHFLRLSLQPFSSTKLPTQSLLSNFPENPFSQTQSILLSPLLSLKPNLTLPTHSHPPFTLSFKISL